MLQRGYTRAVPATQIGQNLAFVNWTVLTGLALGTYAAVVLLRRRTTATPGYLRFTTLCALGFGLLAWISDGALPASLVDSPVVVDPAWDAPRRAALLLFSVLVAVGLVVGRAGRAGPLAGRVVEAGAIAAARRDARLRRPRLGRRVARGGVALLVQLAVVSAAIGGVFAAMILGHWYLVTPKLPEAPLILLARVLLAVVVVQVVLFWAWIATGAGPADVAPFSSLVGPWALFVWLRLIVGLIFPLVVCWASVQTARTRSMESATGPAVHQRRVDRRRDDPGGRPLFRRRTAGVRDDDGQERSRLDPRRRSISTGSSRWRRRCPTRSPPSRRPPSRSASRSSTATPGRVLSVLAAGRRRIVEVGTAYGYSTLWLALGQPADGTIVTIDPDRERTDLARGWWRQAGHRRRADHRSSTRRRSTAFATASPRSPARSTSSSSTRSSPSTRPTSRRSSAGWRPGALVVADNVLWSGRVSGARPVAAGRREHRGPPRVRRRGPRPTRGSRRRSCRSATGCSSPSWRG